MMVAACGGGERAQAPRSCGVTLLASAGGNSIFTTEPADAVVFRGRLAVDADGSPRAYHPGNRGLDDLAAARDAAGRLSPDVLAFRNGQPYIQGSGDPAPGYYVSMTSLRRQSGDDWDQRRYVDAGEVPYIVLPQGPAQARLNAAGVDLGDLAIVYNTARETWRPAIVAEYGPADALGEGSMRLADELGYDPDPRRGGTEARENLFLIFAATRASPSWPRDVDEIDATAAQRFAAWGGVRRLLTCGVDDPRTTALSRR